MSMNAEWVESVGNFEVPWQESGAEWLQKMAEISGYSGSVGYVEEGGFGGPSIIELRPDGSKSANPKVLIIPHEDETVTVALAGIGCEPDEATRTHWLNVGNQATSALGTPDKSYMWVALIGEKPSKAAGQTIKLGKVSRVQGMKLTSSEVELWEPVISVVASLESSNVSASIPIRVQGTCSARTWQHARRKAAGDLSRLVAVLSLDWNVCIDVRESPRLAESGVHYETPSSPFWAKKVFADPPVIDQVSIVSVPPWIDGAWKKLNKNRKLDSALAMHMEGLRLTEDHPSLALVAFVSCVEVISLMIYRDDRCPECKAYTRISDKFRETLKRVTTEAEANYLHRVYNDRSRTVHNGRLHGGETRPGIFEIGLLMSPEAEFVWEIVWRMQAASRKLLLSALQDQLPPGRIHFVK
ncbi:hypothetical protein ACWD4O_09645 [Streptomyces sp. NPDC002623]